MKPEPVTCRKCGYEFQSRSPHPQCRKCRSYDVLYVSMLSRAKLQSVRVLVNVPVSGCEAVRSTGLVGHVPARPKRRNEPMHRVGEMADPRYDGGATAQGGVPGDRARDRLQVSRQATAAKASRIAGSSPAPVPNARLDRQEEAR